MNAERYIARIGKADLTQRTGRVRRILPTFIEADGPAAPRGAICAIEVAGGRGDSALAEVVSVNYDSVVLAPFETDFNTFPGAAIVAREDADAAPVGDAFLGRAVDAFGRPLDGGPPIVGSDSGVLGGAPSTPLERTSTGVMLETGVRAVDSLLTLAVGQRVGIFAAAGVGKTSLLTQIAQQTNADCCVICLVGERGREVEALWERELSAETRERTVLVAATADQAAALRVRAGNYALALADHWRQQGRHVLLLLDSVTRLAMAMRETGLAAGEPPTVRAYTPGVFAAIPKLVEQCGGRRGAGAITAVFTVLAESDEVDDPISEMMKSLLDGHILLSRKLAEEGHFPAIDVPRSISRLAKELLTPTERRPAERAIALLSTYEHARALIETGVYVAGANREIDEAIAIRGKLGAFLRQDARERVSAAEAFRALERLLAGGG